MKPYRTNDDLPAEVRRQYADPRCVTVFRLAFNASVSIHGGEADKEAALAIAHDEARKCMVIAAGADSP